MKRALLVAALLIGACTNAPEGSTVADSASQAPGFEAKYHDAGRALTVLETLSSDAFQGRRTGEQGNLDAQDWIEARLMELGAPAFTEEGYRYAFYVERPPRNKDEPPISIAGTNLVARIAPDAAPSDTPVIAITAHYDHLGMRDGEIFNGADDNASGVAALFSAIEWFQANPPENEILFIFFDAEERGLTGSHAFVEGLPDSLTDRIALNINFDMVSRADKGELYAVGSHHFPELVPLIDGVADDAPIKLLRGHDSPEWGDQDWSLQSDHAAFLRAGIPIIYLGVEDHADYHRPSDTFDKVDPEAFARTVDTTVMVAEAADDWVAEQP